MGLFLPFTPKGKTTELAAIKVKRHLGMGPYASVDPWDALPAVPARLIDPEVLPPELRARLTGRNGDGWSAIGYGKLGVEGTDLILLNPDHHEHRHRASLMEEIVHIVLDHPKVRLVFDSPNGRWRRPFKKAVEDEAYNVGAACVIPYKALFNAVKDARKSALQIAQEYGVSIEYVNFRINRAGLHRVYRKAQARNPN